MKFVDEFRDATTAEQLAQKIRSRVSTPHVIMEVCGGQTHSLLRYGIDRALTGSVELIHGPGCPVCVTDVQALDEAQQLAMRPDVVLASFGDMLRVPGSRGSLLTARAAGANVLPVYSPLEAVRFADEHPDTQVVFFAVGFETTAPSTAVAVLQAERQSLRNFSLLTSHVRVLPAMEALMESPARRMQGFLAAGHVCAITGYEPYEAFCRTYNVPVVVTGFEPLDLLRGILECVTLLEQKIPIVRNSYGRTVNRSGNHAAQQLLASVYEPCDQAWRGFGIIREGGYRLRPSYRTFDARQRFFGRSAGEESRGDAYRGDEYCRLPVVATEANSRCRAGDVLSGRLKPCDCPEFATGCTPDHPLGSPMVSTEGACAAYFRYHRPIVTGEN